MSKGGIADRMIAFNGFPFLDTKEEHSFGVPVSTAMTSKITCFPATGLELSDLHRILDEDTFQGYPIVDDLTAKTLIGYIGRTELLYAINRMQREQRIAPNAKCFFTPPNSRANTIPVSARGPAVTFDTMSATAGQASIDFSRFIDATPISVHPRLPLETVMEVFKKMGPRVILIEHRGKLTGLVTVKDCLKYQFKVEAQENPKDDNGLEEREERMWKFLTRVAVWIQKKRQMIPWQGTLRLGETGDGHTAIPERSDGSASPIPQASAHHTYSQTEVELEDR
jgi:chloride channel 3/4/5